MKSSLTRIALDAMGGDHGLSVIVPAAIRALKKQDDMLIILVGDEVQIKAALKEHKRESDPRILIKHASEVVTMEDSPALALRKKKDSSMRVSINLVKNGEADAVVSAGNTGALMATAKFVLRMIKGIDRPALCTPLPKVSGHSHILDLGSNVDCTGEQLRQFAVMGSVLSSIVDNCDQPRVSLLNVGSEAIKGNEQVKIANALLEKSNLNYVGYAEGDDIFHGDSNVIVCDGFVGNVALKSSEGLARLLTGELKNAYKKNMFTRFAALLSLPVLNSFKKRFDPRRYNGASLLGVQGIVIKSHGSADELSYSYAINIAYKEALKQVPKVIAEKMDELQHLKQEA